MKKCPACRTWLFDDMDYCFKCLQSVEENERAPRPAVGEAPDACGAEDYTVLVYRESHPFGRAGGEKETLDTAQREKEVSDAAQWTTLSVGPDGPWESTETGHPERGDVVLRLMIEVRREGGAPEVARVRGDPTPLYPTISS